MIKYEVTVYDDKTEWRLDGKLHREDGPAIELKDGTRYWYKYGKCHREDGPAIIWKDGSTEWRIDGKLHREDGPALEYSDGRKQYWIDGMIYTKELFIKKTIKQVPTKELTIAEIEKLLGYGVKIVKG